MSYKSQNLIASEDLDEVLTWQLPNMDGSGKVLSSAEKEARDVAARANEVIEDVEDVGDMAMSPITAEQLQAITEAAEKEGFEKGEKEGFEQGQKSGHEAGYREGTEKAEREASALLEKQTSQLLQVAEALVNPIAEQQENIQNILLQYVTGLTRQVVERELIQDSAHILSVVKQAMMALPVGAEKITVFLNPDDLALVEAYSEENDKGWRFRGDSELLPGGCRIETRESLVDFSVESKLEAMFSQFLDRQLMDSTLEPVTGDNDQAEEFEDSRAYSSGERLDDPVGSEESLESIDESVPTSDFNQRDSTASQADSDEDLNS